MGPLFWNTSYVHQKQVLSTEAAMFITEAQTGQTKHLLSFNENWRLPQEGEGEVRDIQLQHATSPLDVTKLHTLNL